MVSETSSISPLSTAILIVFLVLIVIPFLVYCFFYQLESAEIIKSFCINNTPNDSVFVSFENNINEVMITCMYLDTINRSVVREVYYANNEVFPFE